MQRSAKSGGNYTTYMILASWISENAFKVQFGFSTLVLNTQGQGMDGVFAESNVHGTVLSADISFKKYTDGKIGV